MSSRLRLVAGLLLLLFLLASGASAQERGVTLTFTNELTDMMASDGQGELSEEIANRILGLSPEVSSVRVSRSGGRVNLEVTTRPEDDIQLGFRLALDKMFFYRLRTARSDANGMTELLQQAKEGEPLIRSVAYRCDARSIFIDLALDVRPAIRDREEARARSAKTAGAAPAALPATATDSRRPGDARVPGSPLRVKKLGRESAPEVDGILAESAWIGARQLLVEVQGASGRMTVEVRGLWSSDRIWLLVRWPDRDRSDAHRPWRWSGRERAYVEGQEKEDALAISFANESRIGDCMLAGNEAVADVWTWRAERTDPAGIAEDGTLVLSLQRIPQANSYQTRNGRTLWVRETPDAGEPPYRMQVIGAFAGERAPRYLSRPPSGSIADVRARGAWKNGFWTLELSRRLSTGDPADVVFSPGQEAYVSVAVFDKREGADHSTSAEFALRLEE